MASGQLAGVLQGMRGQDIDVAGQNAGFQQQREMMQGQFGQQTNLANMQAKLQQMGMNDQASLGYLAQLMGIDEIELKRQLGAAQVEAGDKGIFGDILQAGGAIGASYAGRKP